MFPCIFTNIKCKLLYNIKTALSNTYNKILNKKQVKLKKSLYFSDN